MDKYKIICEIEKVQIVFVSSPTKGLVFFENLLLSKNDNGVNEAGYNNLRKSFAESSKDQIKLVENVILSLKNLRSEVQINDQAKDFIEQQCNKIRDEISTNKIIVDQL